DVDLEIQAIDLIGPADLENIFGSGVVRDMLIVSNVSQAAQKNNSSALASARALNVYVSWLVKQERINELTAKLDNGFTIWDAVGVYLADNRTSAAMNEALPKLYIDARYNIPETTTGRQEYIYKGSRYFISFASEKPLAMANDKVGDNFRTVWYVDFGGGEDKQVNGTAYTYKLHRLTAGSAKETVEYYNGTSKLDYNETVNLSAASPVKGWSEQDIYNGINDNLDYYSGVVIDRDFLTVLPDFQYLNIKAQEEFREGSEYEWLKERYGDAFEFESGKVIFTHDDIVLAEGYRDDPHLGELSRVIFYDYRPGTYNGTGYTYVGHEVNGQKKELYFNETGKQIAAREVNDSVISIPAKDLSMEEIKKIILEHPAWYKNAEVVQKTIDDALTAENIRKAEAVEQQQRYEERLNILRSNGIDNQEELLAYAGKLGREHAAMDGAYRTAQEIENRNKAIDSLISMLFVNNYATRDELKRGVDQLELAYGLRPDELNDVVSYIERSYPGDIHYNDILGRDLLTFKRDLDSTGMLKIVEENEGTYGVNLEPLKDYIKEHGAITPQMLMRRINYEMANSNDYLSSSYSGMFSTSVRNGHNEPMLNAVVQSVLLNEELQAQDKSKSDLYIGILFNFSGNNGVIRYSRPMTAVLVRDANNDKVITRDEIFSLNTPRQEGDDYLEFDLSKYNSISFFDINNTSMKMENAPGFGISLPGDIKVVGSIEGDMKDKITWDFRDDKIEEYVYVGGVDYNVEDAVALVDMGLPGEGASSDLVTYLGAGIGRVVLNDGTSIISGNGNTIQVRSAAADYTEIYAPGSGLAAEYQNDLGDGLWEVKQYDYRDPRAISYVNQNVSESVKQVRENASYVVHITSGMSSVPSKWSFYDVYYSAAGREIARDNNLTYDNLKVNAGNLNDNSAVYVIDARFGDRNRGVITSEGFFMRADALSNDTYNQIIAPLKSDENKTRPEGYYSGMLASLDTFQVNQKASMMSTGYAGSNVLGLPGRPDSTGPPEDFLEKKADKETKTASSAVQNASLDNKSALNGTAIPEVSSNVVSAKNATVSVVENVSMNANAAVPAENGTGESAENISVVADTVPTDTPETSETAVEASGASAQDDNTLAIDVSSPNYTSGEGWASIKFVLEEPIDASAYNTLRMNISGSMEGQQIIVQMLDAEKSTSSDMGTSRVMVLDGDTQTVDIPMSEFKLVDLTNIDKINIHYGESAWGRDLNDRTVPVRMLDMKLLNNGEIPEAADVMDEFEDAPAAVVHEEALGWMKDNRGSTGLFISHPGHPNTGTWGITYDEAIGAMAMMKSGDRSSAEKVLDFFAYEADRAPTTGLYYTAYDVNSGNPAEWNEMVGPTAWIVLAMAWYTEIHDDDRYMAVMKEMTDAILSLQQENGAVPEGRVAGLSIGTRVYTEHDIDVYAITKYLADKTGKAKYVEARDAVSSWIVTDMFDGTRLLRGLNENGEKDYTLSSDVQAWGASAGIPGMDKENMLEAGEYNSKATVSYTKEDGTSVEVTGFAFQSGQEMVTPEWTAHNALAWLPLDEERYNFYLNEMDKMRTSEGGLPYASLSGADTLQGWITPPASVKASMAGTAYVYLAENKFDPLSISAENATVSAVENTSPIENETASEVHSGDAAPVIEPAAEDAVTSAQPALNGTAIPEVSSNSVSAENATVSAVENTSTIENETASDVSVAEPAAAVESRVEGLSAVSGQVVPVPEPAGNDTFVAPAVVPSVKEIVAAEAPVENSVEERLDASAADAQTGKSLVKAAYRQEASAAASAEEREALALKNGNLLITGFDGEGIAGEDGIYQSDYDADGNYYRIINPETTVSISLANAEFPARRYYNYLGFAVKGRQGGEEVSVHIVTTSGKEYTETFSATNEWQYFTSKLSSVKVTEDGKRAPMVISFKEIRLIEFSVKGSGEVMLDSVQFDRESIEWSDLTKVDLQGALGGSVLWGKEYPRDESSLEDLEALSSIEAFADTYNPAPDPDNEYIPVPVYINAYHFGKMISAEEFKLLWLQQQKYYAAYETANYADFGGKLMFVSSGCGFEEQALIAAKREEYLNSLSYSWERVGCGRLSNEATGDRRVAAYWPTLVDIQGIARSAFNAPEQGWEEIYLDKVTSPLTIRYANGFDAMTLYPNGYVVVYEYDRTGSNAAAGGMIFSGTITIYDDNGMVVDRAEAGFASVLVQPTVGLLYTDPNSPDPKEKYELRLRPLSVEWESGLREKYTYKFRLASTIPEEDYMYAAKEVSKNGALLYTEKLDQSHGQVAEHSDAATGKVTVSSYIVDDTGITVLYEAVTKDRKGNTVNDRKLLGSEMTEDGDRMFIYGELVENEENPVYVIMKNGEEFDYYSDGRVEKILQDAHEKEIGRDMYIYDAGRYSRTKYTRSSGESITFPLDGDMTTKDISVTWRDDGDGNTANDEVIDRAVYDEAGRELVRFYDDQISVVKRDAEGDEVGADIYDITTGEQIGTSETGREYIKFDDKTYDVVTVTVNGEVVEHSGYDGEAVKFRFDDKYKRISVVEETTASGIQTGSIYNVSEETDNNGVTTYTLHEKIGR
ncbi:MAG: hypothetical protein WC329_06770, partial [Candidatus Omnitrophota bacterium]